jgi:hypothetical protein
MIPFKPRAICHRLPNLQTVWKIQASCNRRDSGKWLPGDMNIFRPHDFPLSSGNTDAALVNHPALVNTSDQPSFCSNFSLLLILFDYQISALCQT